MKLATKIEPNLNKLDILTSIGWRYLEIYTNRSVIESPLMIGLLLSYPEIEYVVHAPTDYFDKSVIDFAHQINAKLINTHKILSNDDLKKLTSYAKKKGITITVENESFPESHHLDKHGNLLPTVKTYDPIRSAGDFHRLVEEIPDIRLCIDVEHALIRKEYPSILDSCYELLGHIHLCGFNGGEHHRPVYENMQLVQHLATTLRKYKYHGFIVCEHSLKQQTLEVWKKTLEECASLFGE